MCSGNGKCDCGKCACNPGWKGKACECRSTNDTCIQPGTNMLCSGKVSKVTLIIKIHILHQEYIVHDS